MPENSDLTGFSNRLKTLIHALGLKQGAFAKEIGVNDERISNIIKRGKENFTYSLLQQIFDRYPDLSADWLCRGRGSMWIDRSAKNDGSDKTESRIQRAEDVSWKELVSRVQKLEERADGKK